MTLPQSLKDAYKGKEIVQFELNYMHGKFIASCPKLAATVEISCRNTTALEKLARKLHVEVAIAQLEPKKFAVTEYYGLNSYILNVN